MAVEQAEYESINTHDLILFLCVQDIISASDIVDAGVKIIEEVRDRFVVRTVWVSDKPVYIIKHARDKKAYEALLRELVAYRCLQKSVDLMSIAPKLIMSNSKKVFMVIKWISDKNPINTHVSQEEVVGYLGHLIGKLHQNTFHTRQEVGSSSKPGILQELSHQKQWEQFPELNMHIKSEWKDILMQGIKKAGYFWSPDALIHGDLKWEHCLFGDNENVDSLQLIDWELATFGDSAWDVACIIGEIIFYIQYETEVKKSMSEVMQSERIKIFVQNYLKERPIEDCFLERVSFYLGARLFQTGLELVSVYGWEDKESGADILVSMAVDIFDDPDRLSKILKHRCLL